jgi:hypothetical protein
MALESKKKVIGGVEYTCLQFAGEKNFDIFLDLVDMLGPVLAAVGGGLKGHTGNTSLMDMDLKDLDVEGVVNALLKTTSDRAKIFGFFRDKLFASTYANDQEVNAQFNELFAGPKIRNIAPLTAFVIGHNFGDFSGLVGGIMRDAAPAGQTEKAQS